MTSSLIVLAFDTMDEAEQVRAGLVKGWSCFRSYSAAMPAQVAMNAE